MRSTPTWSAKTASKTAASTTNGRSEATGIEVSVAVATTSAPHATKPATNTYTRAVPRSRIVARSAVYSSCSRTVVAVITDFLDELALRGSITGKDGRKRGRIVA